jgi:hypothetical protein
MQSHTPYPVHLEVQSPTHYQREQLFLRVLICISIGIVQQTMGGLFGVLYILLPTLAAILISQRRGRGFLEHDAGWLGSLLDWVVAFYAYMLFVTDRFPLERAARPAHLHVALTSDPTHSPSLSDALLRLLTSLPHALVLGLLGLVASVVALLSALFILFTLRVPESLRSFQRDFVSWLGRVLAYHASLVDVYPPFHLSPDASPRGALAP